MKKSVAKELRTHWRCSGGKLERRGREKEILFFPIRGGILFFDIYISKTPITLFMYSRAILRDAHARSCTYIVSSSSLAKYLTILTGLSIGVAAYIYTCITYYLPLTHRLTPFYAQVSTISRAGRYSQEKTMAYLARRKKRKR